MVFIFEDLVLLLEVLVGFYLFEETLCKAFIFSLETSEHDNTGNHPEDTWITELDQVPKTGIFFFGGFQDCGKCEDLALFALLQKIPLPFLPKHLILAQRLNQIRVISQLRINQFDVFSEVS